MNRKIVILNGDPRNGESPVNNYLKELEETLAGEGAEIKVFELRNIEIKHCIGCFDCWLKTPGICRFKDDVEDILREIVQANLLISASPLIMGMYSAVLKRFQDRMIPILHPYLEIVNNECHHQKRYPSYPAIGFIYFENDATQDEIENVHQIHKRMALNMRGEMKLFSSVQQKTIKDLSHEIIHI